jgi:LPS O-antigen subunit length determinant protein (WzzB/FepE family)
MEQRIESEITVIEVINKGRSLIRFLWSKRLAILLIAFLFGLVGILYAWLQKPIYTAEMSFTTETENGGKLNAYAGLAAQFGFDLGGGSNNIFEGDNLAELLKSRKLVIQTLLTPAGNDHSLMIDQYLIKNDIKFKTPDVRFYIDPARNTRFEDSVLNMVYVDITKSQLEVFRKDKKLSIIILRMTGNDESFCKNFVELLAKNAIQFYTDYKSRKARQNVEILQRQTDSVRSMLFGSISDVAAINDLNVNPMRQSLKTPAQRKQIDVQVNGTLYGELLKNLELSRLSLRKETPLIQVIDTPQLPLDKKKPGRLLTGILFAFFGGSFTILFLLCRKWYLKNINSSLLGNA